MSTKSGDKTFSVAEYFIKKNAESNLGLTPLKMQKLLYYSQAWSLVLRRQKLFDDDFQAWVHGPAIPRVWQSFREFDFSEKHPDITEQDFTQVLAKDEIELLDSVWAVYGKFDGKYLEALTHAETPWLEARKDLEQSDPSQNIITTESMSEYYGKRLSEAS